MPILHSARGKRATKASAASVSLPLSAAIYCRVSKDATGNLLAVKRQEADSKALARSKGWKVAKIYTDNDLSAYSGKPRPAYRQMLEAIKAGTVDGLIAWHPDRLHRSPVELEEFITVVESAGIQIATVQGGDYDLTTSDGRFNARIVGSVARHESEHKSERLKRKHLEIAQLGGVSGGGDRPFGYEEDRLHVRPAEAKLIRDGAKRVIAGDSLRSVVRAWNASGIKTVRGKAWIPSAVRRVLNAARNAGVREHNGVLYQPVKWRSIITRAEWEQLRAIFNDDSRRTNGTARKYLLTGFLRCGRCDHKLIARPRAAECTHLVEMRDQRSALRDRLGAIRLRLATAVKRSEIDALLQEQEDVRNEREWYALEMGKTGPHVPVKLRDARKKRVERRCRCGAPVKSEPTYTCATGSGAAGCGKVRRLAEPVERLVSELVIARVDGTGLRKAIQAQQRAAAKPLLDLGGLTALEAQLDGLARDYGDGLIQRREWLAARDKVQAKIDALRKSLPRPPTGAVLVDFAAGKGVLAAKWPKLAIDERRAILAAVLDRVVVRPAKPGLNKFDASLIEPYWRL